MRVAIRVDSSIVVGSGHLMRCLTLAEQLHKEKNAEVHFISRDLEGNLNEVIKAAGFILHILPHYPMDKSLTGYATWLTVPQNVDAQETKAVLQKIGKVNCLVIDNYAIDIVWEQELHPFADEIFVIDDLANRKHNCDVLLDQNFYLDMEKRYTGFVPSTCKLLLGPRYALLREEFYEAKIHLRKRDGRIRQILVFYGGSDLTNETMKALVALRSFHQTQSEITVNVIVGAGNPHKQEIKSFCNSPDAASWIQYYCQINTMAKMMSNADLMLGAGGSTTWERCYLELPAIVTAVAKNQEKIAEDCAAANYITYLGRAENVSVSNIVFALQMATIEQLATQILRMREIFRDGEIRNGSRFTQSNRV